MSRSALLTAVETHLESITTPTFQQVYRGMLYSVPAGDRVATFWYAGDVAPPEGRRTMGNAMNNEVLMIQCYWRPQLAAEGRADLVLEQWNANRAIQAALRGDSTLGGNCEDLDIASNTVGVTDFGGNIYHALTITVHARHLNAEDIAP